MEGGQSEQQRAEGRAKLPFTSRAHLYIQTHAHTCTHTVYIIHTQAHTHTRTHTHTSTHTHTRTHAHMQAAQHRPHLQRESAQGGAQRRPTVHHGLVGLHGVDVEHNRALASKESKQVHGNEYKATTRASRALTTGPVYEERWARQQQPPLGCCGASTAHLPTRSRLDRHARPVYHQALVVPGKVRSARQALGALLGVQVRPPEGRTPAH